MAVAVKRVERLENPMDVKSGKKVYGVITYKYVTPVTLKEMAKKIGASGSSASEGQAISILKDFRTLMYRELVEGRPVNIDGLGYFYLSVQSDGADTPEEFSMRNIKGVRICFRANNDIRINTGRGSSTRSEGLTFRDVDRINGTISGGNVDEELPGGEGGNGGGSEAPDPLGV